MPSSTIRARAEHGLDRLHSRVRDNLLLQRFTIFTRILLAVGFIPPSIVKIRGERFTAIPVEHPIGFFFEAMFRTGAYWNFIGWAQLVGALLLLHPATATLGALIFFTVILNIFVITVSLHFAGTWVVTGLMLLACVYLLCWDYHRFKPILFPPPAAAPKRALSPRGQMLERAGYVLLVTSGVCVTLMSRRYVDKSWLPALLAVAAVAGCVILATLVMEMRARRAAVG